MMEPERTDRERVEVRCSAEDIEAWRRAATQHGMTLSAWLRQAAREALREKSPARQAMDAGLFHGLAARAVDVLERLERLLREKGV